MMLCGCLSVSLSRRRGSSSGTAMASFNVEDGNTFGTDAETSPQSCGEIQTPGADEQPTIAFNHLDSWFCDGIKEFPVYPFS